MENDDIIEIEQDDDAMMPVAAAAAAPNANLSAVDEAMATGNAFAVIEIDSSMRLKNVALIWSDGTDTRTIADTFSATPTLDLSVYENRVRTFEHGWAVPFITPIQMAKAGLYYLGNQDCVKCILCSKEFASWKPHDNPYDEHKRVSPDCPFFIEAEGDVEESACTTIDKPKVVYDRFNNYVKNFRFREIILPHNKAFTSLEARLRTFANIQLQQDSRTFCEAGLYYIGNGENDKMLCFCCNQGLMDWECHDDPWVEHARWSPNCSFVLLSKGKDFVDQVLSESCNVYKERQDNSSTSDTKNISKTLAEMNLRKFSEDDESLNALVPESMLCKICYREKMQVLSIPCGHVFACIQCAVTLDQCAVCRHPFSKLVRIDIRVREMINHLNVVPRLMPKNSGESTDLLTCVLCRKEEMQTVFVPCTHIACCERCAVKTKACPVCFNNNDTYIQVFI